MKILVLGAGIAGCSIVHQLMAGNQDLEVLLIEEHSGPAQETSGHRLAMAHPQIAIKKTKITTIYPIRKSICFSRMGICPKTGGCISANDGYGVA
jgi:glycine/D-amino acid oxidase-like deaminating enzyme